MKKYIAKKTLETFLRIRKIFNGYVAEFAEGVKNKKVLEIGSGTQKRGKGYYSVADLFVEKNEVLTTDIVPDFGHKIIDVTKMKFSNEFDVIICMNVLEHVYEYQKAIDNIHKALKSKGTVIVASPMFYPLHDEPGDYWRFTEHALRKMFCDFKITKFEKRGVREFAQSYYFEARKI